MFGPQADPATQQTTAAGPGVLFMLSGQPMEFAIEARDQYGNLVAIEGLDFVVTIEGRADTDTADYAATNPAANFDAGTGTYQVQYTGPAQTGEYDLSVTSSGEQISGSPFQQIICDTVTAAAQVVASGPGISACANGAEQWFNIRAYGAASSDGAIPAKLVGGDEFIISVDSPAELLSVEITDSNDGRYTVTYSAQAPPRDEDGNEIPMALHVTFDEGAGPVEIGEYTAAPSPYAVEIASGAVSTNSAPTGEGLTQSEAGGTTEFFIQCKDAWGFDRTDVTEAGIFTVTIAVADDGTGRRLQDGAFETMTFDMEPVGAGLYRGEYRITAAGTFTLQISSSTAVDIDNPDNSVIESYTLTVDPSPSVPETAVTTTPTDDIVAGETATFDIVGYDEFGNAAVDVRTDAAGFLASLSTGSDTVTLVSSGPGTYDGTFSERLAGTVTLSITLDGTGVSGSPFSVSIIAAAISAAHCSASGPGTLRPAAGDPAGFSVQARDEFENDRTGTAATFQLVMQVCSDSSNTPCSGAGALNAGLNQCLLPRTSEDEACPTLVASADSAVSSSVLGDAAVGAESNMGGFYSPGAWNPATADVNQWYEMDAGETIEVIGVLARGHALAAEWVTTCTISYSAGDRTEASSFTDAINLDSEGGTSAFVANTDQKTGRATFRAAVQARFVRITPTEWVGSQISMRAAIIGSSCPTGMTCPDGMMQESVPLGRGVYGGEYTVVRSTACLLTVKYGGAHIGTSLAGDGLESPYSVSVRSAGNYPPKCYALGSGLGDNAEAACAKDTVTDEIRTATQDSGDCVTDDGVAGQDHLFTIQSVDKTGNYRVVGEDVYEVVMVGPDASVTIIDGEYTDNCIAALCDARGNSDCAVNDAVDGCTGSGCNADDFTQSESVPDSAGCGTYDAVYRVTLAGQYSLQVTSLGRSIAASPFTIGIVPAPASAEKSVVGSAVAVTTLSTEVQFTIQSKDEFGNLNVDGGIFITSEPTFLISGIAVSASDETDGSQFAWINSLSPRPVEGSCPAGWNAASAAACPFTTVPTVTDHANGTYIATYTSDIGGPMQVSVTYGDVHLEGSPSNIFVISTATSLDPQVGPVTGGTRIELDHTVWQPLSTEAIADVNDAPRIWCSWDLSVPAQCTGDVDSAGGACALNDDAADCLVADGDCVYVALSALGDDALIETPSTWVDAGRVACDSPTIQRTLDDGNVTDGAGGQVWVSLRFEDAITVGAGDAGGTSNFVNYVYYEIPEVDTILPPAVDRVFLQLTLIGTLTDTQTHEWRNDFRGDIAAVLGIPGGVAQSAVTFLSAEATGDTGENFIVRFYIAAAATVAESYAPDRAALEATLVAAMAANRALVQCGMVLTPLPDGERLTTDNTIYYGPSKGQSKVVLLGENLGGGCLSTNSLNSAPWVEAGYTGAALKNGWEGHSLGCHYCCQFGDADPTPADYDPATQQIQCFSPPRCSAASTFAGEPSDPCPGVDRVWPISYSLNCRDYKMSSVTFSYFDVVDRYVRFPTSITEHPVLGTILCRSGQVLDGDCVPHEPGGGADGNSCADDCALSAAGPATGETPLTVEIVGVDLRVVEHLTPVFKFGDLFQPLSAIVFESSNTLTVLTPSIWTPQGYFHKISSVEFGIDGSCSECSYTLDGFDHRYYVPPELHPTEGLSPPIGPSFGGTHITMLGKNGERSSGFELGIRYTCRFGDELTGTVVEAVEQPGCYDSREDAINRVDGSGSGVAGTFDTNACIHNVVCPTVVGTIGTAKIVTVSLNGMQYSDTQSLFTYYAQTGIPVLLDDQITRGIEPDRSPLSVRELGLCEVAPAGTSCGLNDGQTGCVPEEFCIFDGSNENDLTCTAATEDECATVTTTFASQPALEHELGRQCMAAKCDYTPPDSWTVSRQELLSVSYLYACGFQESFQHLMKCRFEDDEGKEDIMQADYVSNVLLNCHNPPRNWVHDSQLSVALNAQDYTPSRLFIYYGRAISVKPYFDDNAQAEYCTSEDPDAPPETHTRCIYRDSADYVQVRGILIQAEDENDNWVPNDPLVMGRSLHFFVVRTQRPDRFQTIPSQQLSATNLTGDVYIPCHTNPLCADDPQCQGYANQTYNQNTTEMYDNATGLTTTGWLLDDTVAASCIQPFVEGRVTYMDGNLSLLLPYMDDYELHFVPDSGITPAIIHLRVSPGVTYVPNTQLLPSGGQPLWQRIVGQRFVLMLETYDSAGNPRRGAGSKAGGDSYATCYKKITAADLEVAPEAYYNYCRQNQGSLSAAQDNGDGSYTFAISIPKSETATGSYFFSIIMETGLSSFVNFDGSPYTLEIVTIDCCFGIADAETMCGLVSTAIGDDCLCKPGYELYLGICTKCKSSFYKQIAENSSCVACPPDTDTFEREGTAAIGDCVCQPNFYNISMYPETGCYDQNFLKPYAVSEVEIFVGCAKCLNCFSCPGDNQFVVKKDYWSQWRRLGDARFVYRCPSFSSWEQCLGSNSTFECNEGYTGSLCSECTSNWILTGKGCQDCNTEQMSTGNMLFQMVTFFAFVCTAMVLMKFVRPEDMVKVKILIDFGQLMSSFAPTFEIDWPDVANGAAHPHNTDCPPTRWP